MILESKTDTILLEEGEVQESTNMEIDADSHIFLMRMLSKFYSDGPGSLIREVASNALDSHRQCGTDDPIIVSFDKNKEGNYEFSIQDFGCGLDNNDVENIIKKYGKSTKRNDPKALGAYGLGFKSPLAYSTSFYFTGRKNGIERKWMMYESDDEANKIDLLYEASTEEKNGVTVIVPVKWSDIEEFYRKVSVQLAYFESVYFNVKSQYSKIKNEDIKIYRSEHFQWSSLTSDKNVHICLDNVYYPIDWDKLGISSISFPIGLRFSLSDGIFPVPNREQLKYTTQAKEIILNKIKLVATYFIEKYNETVKESEEVKDIIDFYQNNARNVPHVSGTGWMDVSNLKRYSYVPIIEPKLKNIKLLSMQRVYEMRDFLIGEYSTKYTLYNSRFTTEKTNYGKRFDIRDAIQDSNKVFICTELSGLQKIYYRDICDYVKRYFICKEKSFKLGSIKRRYGSDLKDYYHILELYNHPRKEWRERIKEWQSITNMVISKFDNVDNTPIPQTWIDQRKTERLKKMVIKGTNIRQKKLEGEVGGKVATQLERYVSGKNCKFVQENFKLNEAHKKNYIIVYGNSENEALFQQLYLIFSRTRIKLVIFTDREFKNLKDIQLHNWIEINTFMNGKHRAFRRLITAHLIHKLEEEYDSVFTKLSKLSKISSSLAGKLTLLKDYTQNHYLGGNNEETEALYKAMLKVAEDQNLFDYSIYGVYKEVMFILNRLPFLPAIFANLSTYSKDESGMVNATRDLFKYYKQRIDWQHYNLPINEEEIIKEVKEVDETLN